jgi:hypothetical protein
VDYFTLIDAVLQAGVPAVNCRTAVLLLAAGINAFEGHAAVLLQQPDAVLALASAVASLVKVWSMNVKGVAVHGATQNVESNRRALSGVPELVSTVSVMALDFWKYANVVAPSSSIEAGASSSITAAGSTAAAQQQQHQQQQQQQQRTASCILLAVLQARSVVVLADAAEAAAAQAGAPVSEHLARAMLRKAAAFWLNAEHGEFFFGPIKYQNLSDLTASDLKLGEDEFSSYIRALSWQRWQGNVTSAAMGAMSALPSDMLSYKLQVLRIRNRAFACLSLCSSVRKLEKNRSGS